MSTSVQVLQNIYGLLQKIENNQTKNTNSSTPSKSNENTIASGTNILKNIIVDVNNSTKASNNIESITTNITKLTKLEDNKKLSTTATALSKMSDSILKINDISANGTSNIKNVSTLFNEIGRAHV